VVAEEPAGKTDFSVVDRMAIQNVIASHFLNLDSCQIDAWIANYAQGATFTTVIAGKRYEFDRPVFEKFFRERFAAFQKHGIQRRHLVSNVLFVSQSEESAYVKANGLLLTTANWEAPGLVSGLTYEGWFVRHGGVWKIKRWVVRGDTKIDIEFPEGVRVSCDADQ
jgi:hypothetical protein